MRDMQQLWEVKVRLADGQELDREFSTGILAEMFVKDIRDCKQNMLRFNDSEKPPYIYINPKQVTSIKLERII